MKKKNSIKFSEDGTEFKFIFADGTESIEFQSKEAGFKAVADLANKKKITVGEFGEIRDQIFQADNLPWSEKKKVSISVGILGDFGILGGLLAKMAEVETLSSLLDLAHAPEEPVETAYFKMCDCGGDHGRIYCKECYTGMINSKKQAMNYLNELQGKEFITVEEIVKVREEVEGSKLPVE